MRMLGFLGLLLACVALVLVVAGDDSGAPGERPIKWDVAVADPAASGIRVIYWSFTAADAPEDIDPRFARVERTAGEVRLTLIGPDLEPARVQNASNRAACVLVPISVAAGVELRDGSDDSLAVEPNAKRRASVMRTDCPRLPVR